MITSAFSAAREAPSQFIGHFIEPLQPENNFYNQFSIQIQFGAAAYREIAASYSKTVLK